MVNSFITVVLPLKTSAEYPFCFSGMSSLYANTVFAEVEGMLFFRLISPVAPAVFSFRLNTSGRTALFISSTATVPPAATICQSSGRNPGIREMNLSLTEYPLWILTGARNISPFEDAPV
ncbi:hypothetical protein D3C73_599700 [compost metagenome]